MAGNAPNQAAPSQVEAEAHAQQLKEKSAREARIPTIQSWPHDEQGRPMVVVTGQASVLVPTVTFGNVCLGPVSIMRPVPNTDDLDALAVMAREVQLVAEYVCGVEQRLLQWTLDPTTKIERPSLQELNGQSFSEFVAARSGQR